MMTSPTIRGDRDEPVGAVVPRVQTVRAPQFGAGLGVVARDHVTTGEDNLGRAVVLQQGGCRVRVGRLALRVGGTLDHPDRLTSHLVNAQDIRRIVCAHAVEHLDIQSILMQKGRGRESPVQTKTPVVV